MQTSHDAKMTVNLLQAIFLCMEEGRLLDPIKNKDV